MQKTRIDWADYSINPLRGLCPMDCKDNQGKPYCYARRMYKRFKWDPLIRMEPDWKEELPKSPSRVFVGSTMELFGPWVEDWMLDDISSYINDYPQHTFIFLTKQPQNLAKWSPFPDNCWVGVTATDTAMFQRGTAYLADIQASVRFVSIEPLLKWESGPTCTAGYLEERGINWLIVGAQTPYSARTAPKVEWLDTILRAASQAHIPAFVKNNLKPLWGIPPLEDDVLLRQEYPSK